MVRVSPLKQEAEAGPEDYDEAVRDRGRGVEAAAPGESRDRRGKGSGDLGLGGLLGVNLFVNSLLTWGQSSPTGP